LLLVGIGGRRRDGRSSWRFLRHAAYYSRWRRRRRWRGWRWRAGSRGWLIPRQAALLFNPAPVFVRWRFGLLCWRCWRLQFRFEGRRLGRRPETHPAATEEWFPGGIVSNLSGEVLETALDGIRAAQGAIQRRSSGIWPQRGSDDELLHIPHCGRRI